MLIITMKDVFETNNLSKKATKIKHAQNSDNLEEALAYILPHYKGVRLSQFLFSVKIKFK